MPLVYARLGPAADLVPPEFLRELRALYLANVRRNLALSRKLIRVVDILAKAGIDAVPFKGPALALQAYGDLDLRQFTDLDVLIDAHNLDDACRILPSIGFMPATAFTEKHRRWLRSVGKEMIFLNHGDCLEIHWALAERYFRVPLDPLSLPRIGNLELLGSAVTTLSPEAALLVLAMHGAKHGWSELRSVADVGHLVHAHPGLAWDDVRRLARRSGLLRIMRVAVRLGERLAGAPIPEAVSADARTDRTAVNVANEAAVRLFAERGQPGLAAHVYGFLRTRERWRDRALCCLDLALTPTENDWRLFDLPSVLYPLYYLLRPFRLLGVVRHRVAPAA